MSETSKNLYTAEFFDDIANGSYNSAKIVLEVIFNYIDGISSVADFGCGSGSWLRAAHDLGASKLMGVDGPWVTKEMLVDSAIELVTCEMSKSFPAITPKSFDLAMSVEVGEHLPEDRAEHLVASMCSSARYVLFGAAIPGQGGTDHINEQWQSYWSSKFSHCDYLPVDLVRPSIYRIPTIETWYRNNIILYVHKDEFQAFTSKILQRSPTALTMTDVVIPAVFLEPGLRHSLRIASRIPAKILHSVAWRAKIKRWTA